MTEIKIKESGKIEEITVIDPKTGLDWSGDLIGNNFDGTEWTEDGVVIMDQEDFDWWSNYCNEYETADNLIYEFFTDLTDNFEIREPEDAYQKENKMKELYYNYIYGYEFNDLPDAMVKFVEDNQ